MEGHPSRDIREVQDFFCTVGLPVCLEDLNLSPPSTAEIRLVAETSVAEGETIHATWFAVNAEMVEAAIWAADALGLDYKKNRGH